MKKYKIILTADIESNLTSQQLENELVLALLQDNGDMILDNQSDELRVIDYTGLEVEND